MSRTRSFLLALVLGVLGAAPAQAQYEALQGKLRKSWDRVVTQRSAEAGDENSSMATDPSHLNIQYSSANSLFSKNGHSIAGTGIVLRPGGQKSRYDLRTNPGGERYEIYRKTAIRAYRVGRKGDFKRIEPTDISNHPTLMTFIQPGDLVSRLLVSVEKIRRAGTRIVHGKICETYHVTYQQSQVIGLLRELGLNAEPMDGRNRKNTKYTSTFLIEKKTQQLRELHVTFNIAVKKTKKKKKKGKESDWAWEGYDKADSMMRVFTKKAGADPSASQREARSTIRQYSLKATFLTPKKPQKTPAAPEELKKILPGW